MRDNVTIWITFGHIKSILYGVLFYLKSEFTLTTPVVISIQNHDFRGDCVGMNMNEGANKIKVQMEAVGEFKYAVNYIGKDGKINAEINSRKYFAAAD